MLALLFLASLAAAAEECAKLAETFDADRMVVACQAAADDESLEARQRVDALRLLGMAHVLRNDEGLGELSWRRMLILDHRARLPADAGPRFLDVFARALAAFDTQGAVTARLALQGEQVTVKVDDPLRRVARVVLRSEGRTEIVLTEQQPRHRMGGVYQGSIASWPSASSGGVSYAVLVEGWAGAPLAVVAPASTPVVAATRVNQAQAAQTDAVARTNADATADADGRARERTPDAEARGWRRVGLVTGGAVLGGLGVASFAAVGSVNDQTGRALLIIGAAAGIAGGAILLGTALGDALLEN